MTDEIRFPIEVEVNDSDQELCAKVLNGICLDLNNIQGWNEGSRNNFSVNIGICLNALGLFEFEPSCSDPFSIWMDQQDWSQAVDMLIAGAIGLISMVSLRSCMRITTIVRKIKEMM